MGAGALTPQPRLSVAKPARGGVPAELTLGPSGHALGAGSAARSYLKAVFVGFDVLTNAICGGRPYHAGSAKVSSRVVGPRG